jgi:hypothetical protein
MASDKEGVYGCFVGVAILFIGIAIWEVATAFAIVLLYVGLAAGFIWTAVYAYSKITETEIKKKQAELDMKIKAKELGISLDELELVHPDLKKKEPIILKSKDTNNFDDFEEVS